MKLTYDVCESLKVEKDGLNEIVDNLLKIIYKFTNGKKNFDMMFGIEEF